ncbi:MAG: histone deacetylase [Candidatus Aminicenantaceae bacterium]
MTTGIVKDWQYMEHDMGAFHVESPQRIEAIYRMLESEIAFSFVEIKPRFAREEEIQWIHSSSYIQTIKETSGKDRVILDPDTSTSSRSFETALLAAGGLLQAIDFIMEKKISNGFALVRPPGHHAEVSRAMGFCLFNNVAIGAEYLIKKYSLQKILIIDWDLHHGNGTQHSFYSRKDVLFFSTHQFPHYPGTGYWNETGMGDGEGFTVNVPLAPGKNENDYLLIYQNILSPIAYSFKPDFILVSAGFDIYRGDPLGGMEVSAEGFGALAGKLMSLAHELCQDRLLFTLEGGYNLEGLQQGIKHVLLHLGGEIKAPPVKMEISPLTRRELEPVIQTQKKYWPLSL